MKYAEQFFQDSFDIDDYIKGDWDESDYRKINDIDNSFVANSNDKLDMENFMNGEVNTKPLG